MLSGFYILKFGLGMGSDVVLLLCITSCRRAVSATGVDICFRASSALWDAVAGR